MVDLPTALYVISNVSVYCPHDVPVKALRMMFLIDTLSATLLLCLLNDSEVSRCIRFLVLCAMAVLTASM